MLYIEIVKTSMLLITMNSSEISAEVLRDYHNILEKTIPRLGKEYIRERKRMKISDSNRYSRCYTIKTFYKNNWTIIFDKEEGSVGTILYTYYHDKHGLRVFEVAEHSGIIYVYNGHLFQRYSERMKLGITSTLDSVKRFFVNNPYRAGRRVRKENENYYLDICTDGILLGELKEKEKWIVLKTFISKDLSRNDQSEMEEKIIDKLSNEIKLEIQLGKTDMTSNKSKVLNTLLKSIK